MSIDVHRADTIRSDRPVEPVSIHLSLEMPDLPYGSEKGPGALMDADAHAIHDALKAALPGGTYDRLFAVMAGYVASNLRVPRR